MKAFLNFGTLTRDANGKVQNFTPAIRGGGTWIDISSILLQKGFSRTRRIGENGKFARSVLKFGILPTLGTRYIAGEILTAYGDIRAKFIQDDGTPYFIGTIRPTTSMTASNRIEELTLEVIDDSYYLEYVNTHNINIRDCDYLYKEDGESSLIHRLLGYTGGNLDKVKISVEKGINELKFDAIAEIQDGKKTKTVFEDILYEYNLQYRFLEDGTLYIMKSYYDSTKSTPLDVITDDKCIKQITVSRASDSHGGVVVRYRVRKTETKEIYKYDLSTYLGKFVAQKSFKQKGYAVLRHDEGSITGASDNFEFPEREYGFVNVADFLNETDSKKFLRVYNNDETQPIVNGFVKTYTSDILASEAIRTGQDYVLKKTEPITNYGTEVSDNQIRAYVRTLPFGDKKNWKETELKELGIKAKCSSYDPNADLLKYIIGGDRNGGANEFTDYTCKYLIPDQTETPDGVIALARRLYIERSNGNITYQTKMLTDNALKLQIGGVYTLKSDFLGITSLVRILSIEDSKESKADVLSTIKFYGIQDVNSITTGQISGGITPDTPTTFNPLKLTASLERITAQTPQNGVVSFVAKGDVIDLYNGVLSWSINGKELDESYLVENTIANIPITQFSSLTNIVNVSCTLDNDGGTYSDSVIVYNDAIGMKVTEDRDIHTESGTIHNGISLQHILNWCNDNNVNVLETHVPMLLEIDPDTHEKIDCTSLEYIKKNNADYIYSANGSYCDSDGIHAFDKIVIQMIEHESGNPAWIGRCEYHIICFSDTDTSTFEARADYEKNNSQYTYITALEESINDDYDRPALVINSINNLEFTVKSEAIFVPCSWKDLYNDYVKLGGTVYNDNVVSDEEVREWVKLNKRKSYIIHQDGTKETGVEEILLSARYDNIGAASFTSYTFKYKVKDEEKMLTGGFSNTSGIPYSTFQYVFEITPTVDANNLTVNGVPLIDIMYPIGKRIYISLDSQNPSEALLPLGYSEWELIGQGRTLWGAGYEYEVKSEDGTVETRTMGAGVNIEAGLPNIAGAITAWGVAGDYQGAFKRIGDSSYNKRDGGGETKYRYIYNASKGECGTQTLKEDTSGKDTNGNAMVYENKVYGKSDTVQPPALTVYMWVRVG